ncbi:sensor histidine kinase [Malonomonas rubra]|uniref:sensor histidine kinase n=1 Tax=Malonomonas rubra TaxID=57040 RepID=UPI00137A1CAA|nr:HAMP domain-containing sensor histidine kinase [Malonomonas rubra]
MKSSQLKNTGFRSGVEEQSKLQPLLLASILAAVYVVLIALYIFLSGKIAQSHSGSVTDLAALELQKGIYFTVVTGLILFLSSYHIFRKISQKDSLIISQNKALVASERNAISGLFCSSICHDINNLMGTVVGNIVLLKKSEQLSEKDRKRLEDISVASDKLTQLTKRMLAASKGHIPGQKAEGDLSKIVEQTVDFAKMHKNVKGCELNSEIAPGIITKINAPLLSRTLMNLILNAAEATNKNGQILVRLVKEGDSVLIEVHDDGPGIPQDKIKQILEPFYTSKNNGTGLGLLSYKTCCQQHNADMKIAASSMLGGACFGLKFQRLPKALKGEKLSVQ